MKNTLKTKKKTIISKAPVLAIDDNPTWYKFFYLSLISFLLLVDILFQRGVTNILIDRAWGMNNFSYFPWWVQVLVFSTLFALAAPSVNNAFMLFIQKFTARANGKITGRFKKLILFTGISLVITLLFYLFRVKYFMLGDMDIRIPQTVEGQYIDDEYFTMYFLHYLNIFLHNLIHCTPYQTFRFVSVAGGFLFSFLGLLIADLLFETISSIAIFFLFYISIGNLLVFCGYTEIYALPAVSASLYMYTGLLVLKKNVSIIFPFLCMILAVALHKEQVSVLPSFIFLATRKFKSLNKLINVKNILILFIISIPLIYIINAFFHLQVLMPLTTGKESPAPHIHTLFSFSYWWEFFNSQYLSSGVLVLLFVITLFQALKGRIQMNDYSKFFLIAVLFIYSIVFTMYKMRGCGDWDVDSFPAIYLSMFIAYIALTQWRAIYPPRKFFYIISIAILLNMFSCWAWIGINSGDKSLSKIRNMIFTYTDPIHYPKANYPPEYELAFFFDKHGSRDTATYYYKLSYEKYRTQFRNAISNYASSLTIDKDTDKVVPVFNDAIALYPDYLDSYIDLFFIYHERHQYDKMYSLSKLLVAEYDRNPDNVLKDANCKNMLIISINYLYNNSLLRGDTAAYKDAIIKMQQLNISQ